MRPPSRVAVKGKREIMPDHGAACHTTGDFSVMRANQTLESRTASMAFRVGGSLQVRRFLAGSSVARTTTPTPGVLRTAKTPNRVRSLVSIGSRRSFKLRTISIPNE